MGKNIFTKPFSELTADELLHLMDMISEECDSHMNCKECQMDEFCDVKIYCPSDWYTSQIKTIVEAFREENR